MTTHFDQPATRCVAVPKHADRYSADEIDAAFHAARRAIVQSLQESGIDADLGLPLIEALDASLADFRRRG